MKIESVIRLINTLCHDDKLTKARNLINKEWDRITEFRNYQNLNSHAQQFVKIIKEEKEKGQELQLSDSEKTILNLINAYIRDSHFNFAKRLFHEHQKLIRKPQSQHWLSADARYICKVWENSDVV